MKVTKFAARLLKKKGEEYTEIIVGAKYADPILEDRITMLGGQVVKQTKLIKQYEIKGNQLRSVFEHSVLTD